MIIRSNNLDPFWNLAAEEYLLDNPTDSEMILFTWRSAPAVIIGKNQNPWRECNPALIQAHGGILARRSSGGGAVYHDAENLNCTLIFPREQHDQYPLYDLLAHSVAEFGIPAEIRADNQSLVSGDRKFSGNAFCLRRGRALHHATLLVNANLDNLRTWLTPARPDIETKAVASKPAHVMNLAAASGSITLSALRKTIELLFAGCYRQPSSPILASEHIPPAVDMIRQKLMSRNWLFGMTPRFSLEVEQSTEHGPVKLRLNTVKAIITEVHIVSCPQAARKTARRIADTLLGSFFGKLRNFLDSI